MDVGCQEKMFNIYYRIFNLSYGAKVCVKKEPSFLDDSLKIFFFSWVWLFLVGKTCEVIHTGVKCQGNSPVLFKCIIPFTCFYFGIIALVNACK